MRRFAVLTAVLSLIWSAVALAPGPAPAAAQDGTPSAQQRSRSAGLPVGTELPILDGGGRERGRITIEEVVDPFDDYDPGSPPEEGRRFVLLTVALAATGERPFAGDESSL